MFRYFIQLSYKGTDYHGWQIQPNAVTVQEDLNKALSTLLQEIINVVGAGRTDTGVHARFFIAHFDLKKEIDDLDKITFKLNRFLSKSIAVQRVFRVENDVHSRFDATSRTYEYHIHTYKDVFLNELSYFYRKELDINAMNKAAKTLFEYTDFTSFSKLHTDVKTNNCKIMRAEWQQVDNRLIFTIQADRFLRNMVRAIVGTLLEVGEGKLSIEQFRTVIEQKDRGKAGVSVPPQGLFLKGIGY